MTQFIHGRRQTQAQGPLRTVSMAEKGIWCQAGVEDKSPKREKKKRPRQEWYPSPTVYPSGEGRGGERRA